MGNTFVLNVGNMEISRGYSEKMPENLNIRHCHEKYEILYVTEGAGRYIIEGAEYPVSRGTLLLIPPMSFHSMELDPSIPYDRWVLHFFEIDLTPEVRGILSALKTDHEHGYYYTYDSISPSVRSVFDRFESAEPLPQKERELYLKCLLCELILLLSVAKKEKIPYDEAELGVRVIRYLNEHIDRHISLDKLAKRFFVSKYYLCRAFKKHNGISIHGYINQKRVLYAKQLIESGETASGAAYKVGFGDYSAFYRAYVKIVGASPTTAAPERRSDDGI